MYYDFFGINRAPFNITPDASMFFSGGERGAALNALHYAIQNGVGIVKVVGEVGSGKTMLCRMLELQLPDNIEIVYIANPSLAPENILHVIAFELHLGLDENASRHKVMHELQTYLVQRHAEGKQVVIFVEEAQGMPIETLEEIRLLSNLETAHAKLLQIVLFGQPELETNLSQNSIRQLRERITHSIYLTPFGRHDVRSYLNFRMTVAGYRGPELFTDPIIDAIFTASKGLTRRINILADKTLLAAYANQTHKLSKKHVRAALRDSEFDSPRNNLPWLVGGAMAAGTLMAIGIHLLPKHFEANEPESISVVREAETVAKQAVKDIPITPIKHEKPIQQSSSMTPPPSLAQTVSLHNNSTSIPSFKELLDKRMAQTELWLQSNTGSSYTVQIMSLKEKYLPSLKTYLEEVAEKMPLDEIYVYRSEGKSSPYYTVTYSQFPSRKAAKAALSSLPKALRANDPLARSLDGIRNEVGM